MLRTFTQLESRDTVTYEELKEVLHFYVITGAAISAHVVITLIDRATLNIDARYALMEGAKEGYWSRTLSNFAKDADEYKKVVLHLAKK